MASIAPPTIDAVRRPWGRAALWLMFLGPFFFASYGFANWVASRREHVGAIVFDWKCIFLFSPGR